MGTKQRYSPTYVRQYSKQEALVCCKSNKSTLPNKPDTGPGLRQDRHIALVDEATGYQRDRETMFSDLDGYIYCEDHPEYAMLPIGYDQADDGKGTKSCRFAPFQEVVL